MPCRGVLSCNLSVPLPGYELYWSRPQCTDWLSGYVLLLWTWLVSTGFDLWIASWFDFKAVHRYGFLSDLDSQLNLAAFCTCLAWVLWLGSWIVLPVSHCKYAWHLGCRRSLCSSWSSYIYCFSHGIVQAIFKVGKCIKSMLLLSGFPLYCDKSELRHIKLLHSMQTLLWEGIAEQLVFSY